MTFISINIKVISDSVESNVNFNKSEFYIVNNLNRLLVLQYSLSGLYKISIFLAY